MDSALLQITDLQLAFDTAAGPIEVLRGVNLSIASGEVVALVGESGSGKSALGKSILHLHAPPFVPDRARMTGSIRFRGEDLIGAPPERLRRLRASEVALITQDALSGLNPVMRIVDQVAEAARAARPGLSPKAAIDEARAMLDAVGLGAENGRGPAYHAAYPHQLSGGQRQRVIIAQAAIRRPALLIADEPTTALDATVQAVILDLLADLQHRLGMSVLFVTHDLGVVARIADRVAVAYAGQIVAEGPLAQMFTAPPHPYVAGLLACLPGAPVKAPPLVGHAPDLRALPLGCAFAPRCPLAAPMCHAKPAPLRVSGRTRSLCHLAEGV